MKFGVGVIGATGFIGTPYRKEIREAVADADIVALCARRRGPLEEAAREDGASIVTDDWREVVEHPDVDLVLVVTPDALHHEAVMACAKLGKHMICDKPIGANAREAYDMWSAYKGSGLGHFVPFWSRYVPVFAKTKELVSGGLIGDIKGVICRWQNPRPDAIPFTWRDNAELSAGGSVGDVGSHAYDAARWIIGDEAKRVVAHAAVISPPKPDLGEPNLGEALDWGGSHAVLDASKTRLGTAYDYGTILVEFASGAFGTIRVAHSRYLRKGLSPDMELHGTEGSLGIDRASSTISLVRPGGVPEVIDTVPEIEVNKFAEYAFPGVRERADGTASGHPGLDDGWRVQLFTDAAVLSAQRGSWVDLAELNPEAS